MKPLLVAVAHELCPDDSSDELMSPESQAGFRRQVLPLVTNQTLILCEGFHYDQLVDPLHPRYGFIYSLFFGDTLSSTRPTFGGFDPRHQSSQEESEAIAAKYDEWHALVMRSVRIDLRKMPIPAAISEIIKTLKAGPPPASLVCRPSPEQISLARWIEETNRTFDRQYLKAMRTHGRRYDKCIFVGGATHVVSLALKTGYPVADLTLSTDARDVFFSYLSDKWARLFIEAGS